MAWSAEKQREWRKRNREHLNAQAKAYYWAHREEQREIKKVRDAAYRAATREKAQEKSRRWRAENPERVKASNAAHYAGNREKVQDYSRQWRAVNRERKKASNAAYRAANHESLVERERLYYVANREHRKAYNLVYYANHREERREYSKAYREKHRPQVRAGKARRRARKKGVAHTLTVAQWQAIKVAYKSRCAYCNRKMKRLTQDHVVPISQGGPTVVENIVPACQTCNSAKHTNPPPKPVRVLMV